MNNKTERDPIIYKMNYLAPEGYPQPIGILNDDVSRMTGSLKGADIKFVNVPNSALWVRLTICPKGASFEIKKRSELVYVSYFCFEWQHVDSMLAEVNDYYLMLNLGTPKRPPLPTWIHFIPVAENLLRKNEIKLCQDMTLSLFWAVYGQLFIKRNSLN